MIVGMLRIKEEARWIVPVLSSLLPVCERIIVLDDNSRDNTVELARKVPKVTVIESPFEGVNEVRDKNFLLGKVAELNPSWVIHVDGDEEIAHPGQLVIRELCRRNEGFDSYKFRILYLWDSPNQIRTDGIYGTFARTSMFRFRPGAQFRSSTPGGFHCGNVPDPESIGRAPVDVLHYGYMHKEDRIRKWHWYNSIDGKNYAEGYDDRFPERRSYPHMVQSDIPEVPADAVLKHAGPLRLEPLMVTA